ncbi:MAG TPA: DUF4349 domain-containing protein [Candidatus Acidoferrales bacterium]|nr:DUF4349 domain-containing protein [Candidatus Acidoferrales bacterium]
MEPTTHAFNREEVMAYLDGELAPERATAVAAHLELCGECRELAASLRSLSRQMTDWQVGAIPATVEQNVMRAARLERDAKAPAPKEESPARSRVGVRWLAWSGALLTMALVLFVFGIPSLYRSRTGSDAERQRATGLSAPAPAPAANTPALEDKRRLDQMARSYAQRDMKTPAADEMSLRKDQAAGAAAAKAAPAAKQKETGPMIVRRAALALLTKEFDAARASLENLVKAHQGYFGQLNVTAPNNAGRELVATVRVPAGQLDAVLVELRKLGRVEQENQSADDVTRQYVDLTARLANAREEEKRLVDILRERTGRVSDVLEVEQQIASTRQQIEEMDAERKTLDNQVQYASVDLRIKEEYKQSLDTPAPSVGTRINNAAVEGFRDAADLVIGLVLWLLGAIPTLLVLVALLGWPTWRLAGWARRRFFMPAAAAPR